MATDYDFKSMIGSAGNYDEAILKARLFAGLLHTFGAAIGTGKPEKAALCFPVYASMKLCRS